MKGETTVVILNKTAKGGQQIEIRLNTTIACAAAQLFIGGQFVSGPAEPVKLNESRGEVTHWMGREGKAVVGLTTAEAERIFAALSDAVASWKASDEGQADATRTEKRNARIEMEEAIHDEREAVRRIVEAH